MDQILSGLDELIDLFRQWLKCCQFPPKKPKVWKAALRKAEKQLHAEIEERKQMAIHRLGSSSKPYCPPPEEYQKQLQKNIQYEAEKIYRKKDAEYAKHVSDSDQTLTELIPKIASCRYFIEEHLPKDSWVSQSLLEVFKHPEWADEGNGVYKLSVSTMRAMSGDVRKTLVILKAVRKKISGEKAKEDYFPSRYFTSNFMITSNQLRQAKMRKQIQCRIIRKRNYYSESDAKKLWPDSFILSPKIKKG